mmetsp:Transcript_110880/g.207860  ORF Transcript_110880/g.207860 Transcript_110880/m.207860 type:complete len:395 (+) Transcript_110880:22-1206(+)
MDRWPVRPVYVLEHHLAVLQHWWQVYRQRQLINLQGPGIDAFLLQRALSLVVVASIGMVMPAIFRAFLWLSWLWLLGLVKLSPWLAASGVAAYISRLALRPWLRKEWLDFLQQGTGTERVSCAICLESVRCNSWNRACLPCCRGSICWSCVRRHAESVIDDARPEMLCPLLPCRRVLPDVLVWTAMRREQWSWASLDVTGRLRRRKWSAYERWVLSCGLANSCAARAEDVIHCPGDDCRHMWVLPQELRRKKGEDEPKSRWNPRSWSISRHVGFYTAPVADGHDLRSVHCPKCNKDFCLLCGNPWSSPDGDTHDLKACIEHSSLFPNRHSESVKWAGAKSCPGCGVRILRSVGCNHMTCTQCGTEWCWICRSKWHPCHYSCSAGRAEGDPCAIL